MRSTNFTRKTVKSMMLSLVVVLGFAFSAASGGDARPDGDDFPNPRPTPTLTAASGGDARPDGDDFPNHPQLVAV